MWLFALIIALSLWVSTAMAQIYDNGASDSTGTQGNTTQTTDTLDSTNGTGDTITPISAPDTGASNLESSSAGLPATGAGGLAQENLGLLAMAFIAVVMGGLMLRQKSV